MSWNLLAPGKKAPGAVVGHPRRKGGTYLLGLKHLCRYQRNRNPSRAVRGARIAEGRRKLPPVVRVIVSPALLLVRLNKSKKPRSRMRPPRLTVFSVRRS